MGSVEFMCGFVYSYLLVGSTPALAAGQSSNVAQLAEQWAVETHQRKAELAAEFNGQSAIRLFTCRSPQNPPRCSPQPTAAPLAGAAFAKGACSELTAASLPRPWNHLSTFLNMRKKKRSQTSP